MSSTKSAIVQSSYNDLEGGFWGLTTSDGTQLLAFNLPEQMKIGNTDFEITYRENNEMLGSAMWGQIIEIISFTTG